MIPWSQVFDRSLARRSTLAIDPLSAFRVLDGAGDGVPGVFIDSFAGRWLVQTREPELPHGLAVALEQRGVDWWWKALEQDPHTAPVRMGGGGGERDDPFVIVENGLRFEISFRAGYSQGLFLDQRLNRARVRTLLSAGDRFLNLFAYTGGFSVAAAAAGAIATTVDLSAPALEWARRNFRLNGLNDAAHHFVRGDALEWLEVFSRKGRTFRGIVLDPPTFSRVKGRGVWRAEKDYHRLMAAALPVLEPGGWIFASTNCRGMTPAAFRAQLLQGSREAGRRVVIEAGGMPPDFRDTPYLLNAWCEAICGDRR